MYLKEQPFKEKDIPGPGTYKVINEPGQEALKYTMRPMTTNPMFHSPSEKYPGPGYYNTIDSISSNGPQFLSKWQSSLAAIFHPVRSKRFIERSNQIAPGPGQYNPKPSINESGNYFLSNFHSSLVRKFGHERRESNPIKCRIGINLI